MAARCPGTGPRRPTTPAAPRCPKAREHPKRPSRGPREAPKKPPGGTATTLQQHGYAALQHRGAASRETPRWLDRACSGELDRTIPHALQCCAGTVAGSAAGIWIPYPTNARAGVRLRLSSKSPTSRSALSSETGIQRKSLAWSMLQPCRGTTGPSIGAVAMLLAF